METLGTVFQPKLKINKPNEKYEQETDRATDQVIRIIEPKLQNTELYTLS
jgi:hypothetical protein